MSESVIVSNLPTCPTGQLVSLSTFTGASWSLTACSSEELLLINSFPEIPRVQSNFKNEIWVQNSLTLLKRHKVCRKIYYNFIYFCAGCCPSSWNTCERFQPEPWGPGAQPHHWCWICVQDSSKGDTWHSNVWTRTCRRKNQFCSGFQRSWILFHPSGARPRREVGGGEMWAAARRHHRARGGAVQGQEVPKNQRVLYLLKSFSFLHCWHFIWTHRLVVFDKKRHGGPIPFDSLMEWLCWLNKMNVPDHSRRLVLYCVL